MSDLLKKISKRFPRLRERFFRFIGGRPMTQGRDAFIDAVSGNQVRYYRDRLGRWWMAESRVGLFRVRVDSVREKHFEKDYQNGLL